MEPLIVNQRIRSYKLSDFTRDNEKNDKENDFMTKKLYEAFLLRSSRIRYIISTGLRKGRGGYEQNTRCCSGHDDSMMILRDLEDI